MTASVVVRATSTPPAAAPIANAPIFRLAPVVDTCPSNMLGV
jgi:hypothetical protein